MPSARKEALTNYPFAIQRVKAVHIQISSDQGMEVRF